MYAFGVKSGEIQVKYILGKVTRLRADASNQSFMLRCPELSKLPKSPRFTSILVKFNFFVDRILFDDSDFVVETPESWFRRRILDSKFHM